MHLESGIGRRRARVEMIPLIDCMFILLVFFIYSMLSMTVQRGVSVQLPVGRQVDRIVDEAVVITVSDAGELYVNQLAVSLDGLEPALRQAIGADESQRIVINADAQARHGQVFAVLDLLRNRGWTNVSILSTEALQP